MERLYNHNTFILALFVTYMLRHFLKLKYFLYKFSGLMLCDTIICVNIVSDCFFCVNVHKTGSLSEYI